MRLLPLITPLFLFATGCGEGRLVATFEESFAIDDATELLLENGSGDLDIVGEADRTDVTIVVELRSHRASDMDDDRAERDVVMDVRMLEDGVAQIVASIDDPPPGYHIDVTAFVPAAMAMRVERPVLSWRMSERTVAPSSADAGCPAGMRTQTAARAAQASLALIA